VDIDDLIQDNHNFNKGTEAGAELIGRSFKEHGAGRSVLIDKNGRIIAGNKSQQAAIAAGIKKVRVIETTGDELVAVKRTDIDINSKKGREMALADNATTKVNLVFDHVELEKEMFECDLDPNEWGVPHLAPDENEEHEYQVIVDVDNEKEQEKLYNRLTKQGYECKIISM
jgi:ParB-like chromosome segregation protein Spo0J